jgi:hypothetical protein
MGAIQLSLPSPLSFTTGESIHFIRSLAFPIAPALRGLLALQFRLTLSQRICVSWNSDQITLHERKISAGEVQLATEGVTVLSGVIPAGMGEREYLCGGWTAWSS